MVTPRFVSAVGNRQACRRTRHQNLPESQHFASFIAVSTTDPSSHSATKSVNAEPPNSSLSRSNVSSAGAPAMRHIPIGIQKFIIRLNASRSDIAKSKTTLWLPSCRQAQQSRAYAYRRPPIANDQYIKLKERERLAIEQRLQNAQAAQISVLAALKIKRAAEERAKAVAQEEEKRKREQLERVSREEKWRLAQEAKAREDELRKRVSKEVEDRANRLAKQETERLAMQIQQEMAKRRVRDQNQAREEAARLMLHRMKPFFEIHVNARVAEVQALWNAIRPELIARRKRAYRLREIDSLIVKSQTTVDDAQRLVSDKALRILPICRRLVKKRIAITEAQYRKLVTYATKICDIHEIALQERSNLLEALRIKSNQSSDQNTDTIAAWNMEAAKFDKLFVVAGISTKSQMDYVSMKRNMKRIVYNMEESTEDTKECLWMLEDHYAKNKAHSLSKLKTEERFHHHTEHLDSVFTIKELKEELHFLRMVTRCRMEMKDGKMTKRFAWFDILAAKAGPIAATTTDVEDFLNYEATQVPNNLLRRTWDVSLQSHLLTVQTTILCRTAQLLSVTRAKTLVNSYLAAHLRITQAIGSLEEISRNSRLKGIIHALNGLDRDMGLTVALFRRYQRRSADDTGTKLDPHLDTFYKYKALRTLARVMRNSIARGYGRLDPDIVDAPEHWMRRERLSDIDTLSKYLSEKIETALSRDYTASPLNEHELRCEKWLMEDFKFEQRQPITEQPGLVNLATKSNEERLLLFQVSKYQESVRLARSGRNQRCNSSTFTKKMRPGKRIEDTRRFHSCSHGQKCNSTNLSCARIFKSSDNRNLFKQVNFKKVHWRSFSAAQPKTQEQSSLYSPSSIAPSFTNSEAWKSRSTALKTLQSLQVSLRVATRSPPSEVGPKVKQWSRTFYRVFQQNNSDIMSAITANYRYFLGSGSRRHQVVNRARKARFWFSKSQEWQAMISLHDRDIRWALHIVRADFMLGHRNEEEEEAIIRCCSKLRSIARMWREDQISQSLFNTQGSHRKNYSDGVFDILQKMWICQAQSVYVAEQISQLMTTLIAGHDFYMLRFRTYKNLLEGREHLTAIMGEVRALVREDLKSQIDKYILYDKEMIWMVSSTIRRLSKSRKALISKNGAPGTTKHHDEHWITAERQKRVLNTMWYCASFDNGKMDTDVIEHNPKWVCWKALPWLLLARHYAKAKQSAIEARVQMFKPSWPLPSDFNVYGFPMSSHDIELMENLLENMLKADEYPLWKIQTENQQIIDAWSDFQGLNEYGRSTDGRFERDQARQNGYNEPIIDPRVQLSLVNDCGWQATQTHVMSLDEGEDLAELIGLSSQAVVDEKQQAHAQPLIDSVPKGCDRLRLPRNHVCRDQKTVSSCSSYQRRTGRFLQAKGQFSPGGGASLTRRREVKVMFNSWNSNLNTSKSPISAENNPKWSINSYVKRGREPILNGTNAEPFTSRLDSADSAMRLLDVQSQSLPSRGASLVDSIAQNPPLQLSFVKSIYKTRRKRERASVFHIRQKQRTKKIPLTSVISMNTFQATQPRQSPNNENESKQMDNSNDNATTEARCDDEKGEASEKITSDEKDAQAETISLMLLTSMSELEYSISTDLVQAAMEKNGDKPTYFSYEFFRNAKGEKLPLHYCKSFQASETVAAMFLEEKLLGFDLEWNPRIRAGNANIKDNVSVVQLASPTRVAIFQLAMHKGDTPDTILPPSLRKIIESDQVIKTGVSIQGDCSRMLKHLGVKARGLIELSHLHNLVTDRYNKASGKNDVLEISKTGFALAKQVHAHLFLPMFKGQVRVSNWHQELRSDQCTYAATDAWAAVCLFYELERKRLDMEPVPPRPEFAELGRPIIGAQKTQSELMKDVEESTSSEEEDISHTEESEEEDLESDSSEESDDWISCDEELSSQVESLKIDAESTDTPSSTRNSATAPRHKQSSSSSYPSKEDISLYPSPSSLTALSAATMWVTTYTTSIIPTRAVRVGNHKLHAYTLWYHQSADLATIATSLDRKSRLALVATYILDSIELERLPYDVDRIDDLMNQVPADKRKTYDVILAGAGREERNKKALVDATNRRM
jgi:hypothetical protein